MSAQFTRTAEPRDYNTEIERAHRQTKGALVPDDARRLALSQRTWRKPSPLAQRHVQPIADDLIEA